MVVMTRLIPILILLVAIVVNGFSLDGPFLELTQYSISNRDESEPIQSLITNFVFGPGNVACSFRVSHGVQKWTRALRRDEQAKLIRILETQSFESLPPEISAKNLGANYENFVLRANFRSGAHRVILRAEKLPGDDSQSTPEIVRFRKVWLEAYLTGMSAVK